MIFTADSSIVISAFFVSEKNHSDAHLFYQNVMRGEITLVIPASVPIEILCAIGRRLRQTAIPREFAVGFWNALMNCPNVVCKSVDKQFMHETAWMGWKYGLKGMDALVATTAFNFGIPLVSSDKDFESVRSVVEVLTLKEALKRS